MPVHWKQLCQHKFHDWIKYLPETRILISQQQKFSCFSIPPHISPPFLQRRDTYLSTFEIWLDNTCDLGWEWPSKNGTTVLWCGCYPICKMSLKFKTTSILQPIWLSWANDIPPSNQFNGIIPGLLIVFKPQLGRLKP